MKEKPVFVVVVVAAAAAVVVVVVTVLIAVSANSLKYFYQVVCYLFFFCEVTSLTCPNVYYVEGLVCKSSFKFYIHFMVSSTL